MRNRTSLKACLLAACAVAVTGTQLASAAVFNETEPNDNKASANLIGAMVAGDMIMGNTTGGSTTVAGPASSDNFLISFPAANPGIYRNRLVLTSQTLGQTGTIRGLTVAAAPADTQPGIPWDGVIGTPNPGTDSAVQTSSSTSVPPRYNTFYTFGRPTQMYYRVAGLSTTTSDYTSTLETTPVTPTNIGNYVPGQITLNFTGQGHTTDTEVIVFDDNLNPIPGYSNDDSSAALSGAPIATTSSQSWLARNYTPGTYYLAVAGFNLTANVAAPSDDNFRTGGVMDFADIMSGAGSALNANQTFTIMDSAGNTLQVPNTRVDAFDANWFVFTVVPEPASLGLLAAGLPLVMRRRRN